MKVSRSIGYALLAVGYIARKQEVEGRVSSQAVSEEYDIPLEYLLKILQQLVRARVLSSKRGPQGGFWLAAPPSKITMLDIIEAVDGPLSREPGLSGQARRDKYCARVDQTYNRALAQARAVYKNAKLSILLGKK